MIAYAVRTSDGRACAPAVQTLAEARAALGEATESGLRSAAIYAHLGPPANYVVLSRPAPAGVTDAERDGVRLDSCSVVYVADTVSIGESECLADPAYLAGYLDGLSRDLDGYGSVDELRAGRDLWGVSALYRVGGHAIAQVCDVASSLDLWWTAVLSSYDAGCQAGVLAPQSHRTGRPPCR